MSKATTRGFRFSCYVIALILISSNSRGQNFDLGSWNILNLRYNFTNKWSVFGEAQIRSIYFYDYFYYYEYKGGVDFKVLPNMRMALGLGHYLTYQDSGNFVLPKVNDEFRIWPQIILQQTTMKINIEHRYRAEFRFTSDGYKNRFRYRLALSYPFGKNKRGYQPFQVILGDEIFLTDKSPYFERNRFLVACNYRISRIFTTQLGYIYQFDYKKTGEIGRDYLMVGLYIELFSKKSQQTHNNVILDHN